MGKATFPPAPFDGQIFVDNNNIQWYYDMTEDVWLWIGPILVFPIAKSGNECE